jgi:hypothetical protein
MSYDPEAARQIADLINQHGGRADEAGVRAMSNALQLANPICHECYTTDRAKLTLCGRCRARYHCAGAKKCIDGHAVHCGRH